MMFRRLRQFHVERLCGMSSRALLAASCALAAVALTARHCRPHAPPATHTRTILSWVPFFTNPYFGFGDGSPAHFEAAGCTYTACEIVADLHQLPLDQYDALLFHGFEFYEELFGTPYQRSPHQLYVFMSLEAARRSLMATKHTHFYNLTMTYRLDSDIPWPYFMVIDQHTGKYVAPSLNPVWESPGEFTEKQRDEISRLVAGKKRMAAWFVSNCHSDSGREALAQQLAAHGVEIDTYGYCGDMSCPLDQWSECVKMVGRKYYFYFAFENSLCEDYVTEKSVTALSSGAVPVILSGAELHRFLPPGSYVDARANRVAELAETLRRLAASPEQYTQLLQWRARYRVERSGPSFPWLPGQHPMCALCERLHQPQPTTSTDYVQWWQATACSDPP